MWTTGLASFASLSAAVARKHGSWRVLLTEGYVLPVAIAAALIALLTVVRVRLRREP